MGKGPTPDAKDRVPALHLAIMIIISLGVAAAAVWLVDWMLS